MWNMVQPFQTLDCHPYPTDFTHFNDGSTPTSSSLGSQSNKLKGDESVNVEWCMSI